MLGLRVCHKEWIYKISQSNEYIKISADEWISLILFYIAKNGLSAMVILQPFQKYTPKDNLSRNLIFMAHPKLL